MQQDLAVSRKAAIPGVIKFFLLTYAISWALWGLMILFPEALGEMAFLVIFGAFGPFAAAAILIRAQEGPEGLINWRRRILALRWRWRWHLIGGLGLPFIIAFIHILIYAAFQGLPVLQMSPPWYYLVPAIPVNIYLAVFYSSAFGEEPGWQGYAMPRLLKAFSPISASFILGILWALWHIPLYFIPEWKGQEPLYLMVIYTVPLAMILLWLTQRARGSVFPAVFLHFATNYYGSLFLSEDLFTSPLAMNFTLTKTIIYWLVALVLIWRTNGMLGYSHKFP